MSSRLSSLRLFCRIQLHRSGVDRAAIRQAMRDDDVLQVVLAEIHSTHVSTAALDGMTFLDWLLEHADEIIALIMKIIAMFPASMEALAEPMVGALSTIESFWSMPRKFKLVGFVGDDTDAANKINVTLEIE